MINFNASVVNTKLKIVPEFFQQFTEHDATLL